jgi:hypothetical protein
VGIRKKRKERNTATVMNKTRQSENLVENSNSVKGRRAKVKIRSERKYED